MQVNGWDAKLWPYVTHVSPWKLISKILTLFLPHLRCAKGVGHHICFQEDT